MNTHCIYRINFSDGSFYIGRTKNLKKRIDGHKYSISTCPISKYMSERDNYNVGVLCKGLTRSEATDIEAALIERVYDNPNCLNIVNHNGVSHKIDKDKISAKISRTIKEKHRKSNLTANSQ